MSCRVLAGLPPYGPPAEPFPSTGQGAHQEGLVVEFSPAGGAVWVGNFQRGATGLDRVLPSTKDGTVLVVAGGAGYVVDPLQRACVRELGGGIEQVVELPDRLVFSNGLWLEATDGERLLWRTRRLSWDGMRSLCVEGDRVVGEAYDPMSDDWARFSVELASGEASGGTYPVDLLG